MSYSYNVFPKYHQIYLVYFNQTDNRVLLSFFLIIGWFVHNVQKIFGKAVKLEHTVHQQLCDILYNITLYNIIQRFSKNLL